MVTARKVLLATNAGSRGAGRIYSSKESGEPRLTFAVYGSADKTNFGAGNGIGAAVLLGRYALFMGPDEKNGGMILAAGCSVFASLRKTQRAASRPNRALRNCGAD
jgi:hypothetical protein